MSVSCIPYQLYLQYFTFFVTGTTARVIFRVAVATNNGPPSAGNQQQQEGSNEHHSG